MDRNTSHGRRNQSQSPLSQKLSSRSRRRSSPQRSAGITSTTATRTIAATRCDVRTQNRWPTIWLNDGTYITTPVTSSTSTAAATDQCSAFSVADAGVRVIAPSLPVANAGGLHDGDPAQPLDTFVAVVERHDQPRGRSALRAERRVPDAEGDDHAGFVRDLQVEVVHVRAVPRLEAQGAPGRPHRGEVDEGGERDPAPAHARNGPPADAVEVGGHGLQADRYELVQAQRERLVDEAVDGQPPTRAVPGWDRPRDAVEMKTVAGAQLAERPLEPGAKRAREASAERDERDPAGEAGKEQPASYRLAQASRRRRRR